MTEILTESFCERCGTRYTFESARPRVRLTGVKTLSRGLKNFVLSDDTSLNEAMAAARNETDREATSHQLDAFHKTFSFCMSCRQYTCPNCWNEVEARCLSCAPLALPEPPALIPDLTVLAETGVFGQPVPVNGNAEHDIWPVLEAAAEAPDAEAEVEQIVEAEPEVEPVAAAAEAAEVEQIVEAEPEVEPVAATAEAEQKPAATPDAAGKASAQTVGLLRRFRPGQSLDAELDAYEHKRTEPIPTGDRPTELDAPVAETEEVLVEAPEPVAVELADSAEPEAVESAAVEVAVDAEEAAAIAAAAPAPEAVPVPEPEIERAHGPEPEPLAAATGSDLVEQPTWRITAPDPTGTTKPTAPTEQGGRIPLQASAAPTVSPEGKPQWPATPQWPTAKPGVGLPGLGRPAAPQGGIEALWAASNQELATAPPAPGRPASGIQPCVSCGLSLSATARFCRRCGTLQAR